MTLHIVFGIISALVFSAQAQLFADPGMEPWADIVSIACAAKQVDLQSTINSELTKCFQKIPSTVDESGPSLPFCAQKEVRYDCMRPYYEKIKECFDSEEAKDQVDAAFEIQKRSIDYVCKDNQKAFKDLMNNLDGDCAQKLYSQDAVRCKQAATSPDVKELFNFNNCKVMKKLQDCRLNAVETCKTKHMYDYLKGQYDAMIGDDCPPKVGNDASTAVHTTILLVLSLVAFIF